MAACDIHMYTAAPYNKLIGTVAVMQLIHAIESCTALATTCKSPAAERSINQTWKRKPSV